MHHALFKIGIQLCHIFDFAGFNRFVPQQGKAVPNALCDIFAQFGFGFFRPVFFRE
ncbi:hypothetical protein HMPREF9098_0935 [Kingella denitrificans ATCC 33394]|uniref:Uncharacterized protein n=1 Tax=Kingella denitrificans ATCC 33394 TaxID=888741 RepID=F0EYK1_9NEIS|nr:hypothetical protein HMPREF9098_0935 [Kingella denitrificans ATCC 33394]